MYYNICFFNYVIDSSYDGNPQKVSKNKVYNYLNLNIKKLIVWLTITLYLSLTLEPVYVSYGFSTFKNSKLNEVFCNISPGLASSLTRDVNS